MKKLFLLFLFVLSPVLVHAGNSIEITVGAGSTIVDLDALVEKDEVAGAYVNDWDVTNSGVSVQYFLASNSNIQFGAEFMYQHLYWYQVRIPFGSTPFNRDYGVSMYRLTPIARFGSDTLAFDIGPEFNFLDSMAIGVMASVNYYFHLTDKIDIPIKARVDVFNNIVTTIPVSLNAGIRINFD